MDFNLRLYIAAMLFCRDWNRILSQCLRRVNDLSLLIGTLNTRLLTYLLANNRPIFLISYSLSFPTGTAEGDHAKILNNRASLFT